MRFSRRQQLAVGLSILIGLAGWMWHVPLVAASQARSLASAIGPDRPIGGVTGAVPVESPPCDLADVNGDGVVNIVDVAIVALRAGNSKALDLQTAALIGLCYGLPVAPADPPPLPRAPISLPISSTMDRPLAKLSVSPHSSQVNVNQVFVVSIVISTSIPARALQFGLSFDPAVLHCDSISEGSFYRDWAQAHGGAAVIFPTPACNNAQGTISDMGVLLYGSALDGPQGNGTVAQIQFTALDNGLSSLNLTHVQVLDATVNTQPLPAAVVNGQAIASSIPVSQSVNVGVYATVHSVNVVYLPYITKSAPVSTHVYLPFIARNAAGTTQTECGGECGGATSRMTNIPLSVRAVIEWLSAFLEQWGIVRHG